MTSQSSFYGLVFVGLAIAAAFFVVRYYLMGNMDTATGAAQDYTRIPYTTTPAPTSRGSTIPATTPWPGSQKGSTIPSTNPAGVTATPIATLATTDQLGMILGVVFGSIAFIVLAALAMRFVRGRMPETDTTKIVGRFQRDIGRAQEAVKRKTAGLEKKAGRAREKLAAEQRKMDAKIMNIQDKISKIQGSSEEKQKLTKQLEALQADLAGTTNRLSRAITDAEAKAAKPAPEKEGSFRFEPEGGK